jgi:N utilization substance protein A
LEKISVAVRHYFGQYEEGEERPVELAAAAESGAEGGAETASTEDAAAAAALKAEEASLDEEIDALQQDLTQSGEEPVSEDGSGLINDELAEERLAEVTEVGPDLDEEGAESLVPGRDDTSELLVEHEVNPKLDPDEMVGEGNTEEVKDE